MTSIRPLTEDDLGAAFQLSLLAFGGDASREAAWRERAARVPAFGVFAAETLTATARLRPYAQWFGGRAVPMAGVAGVTVTPHARGGGTARELMTALLPVMRDAGQPISALFPSVVALYRTVGWEHGGALEHVRLDVTPLGRLPSDPAVTLRPVGADDLAAVQEAYTGLARVTNGLLTRTGQEFDPARLLELDAVTAAARDGQITGYVSLTRGREAGRDAVLQVHDLVAADPGTMRSLLRMLAGFAPHVPRAQLRTVPGDGLALTSPLPLEDVGPAEPWLLRIVDAPVAVAGRGWPDGPPGVAEFRLHDDLAPWHAGDWRLVVEEGAGRLERGGSGAAEIHVRGLAALYTCYTGCATLRRAGLLHGDASGDPVLDRLFAGPRAGMLDAF